jgi:hypothetical protein
MSSVALQLERRRTAEPGQGVEARSPLASGAVAGVWAALLGLVVIVGLVLAAWFFSPQPGVTAGSALHAGVLGWLLANRATLLTSIGPVTFAPLGLTILVGYLIYRLGRWCGRLCVEGLPAASGSTAALVASYACVTGFVAAVTNGHGGSAQIRSAIVGASLVALVCGGSGVLSGAGLWASIGDRLPLSVLEIARGAGAGLAVLVCGGALLLGLSLLGHLGRVAALSQALGGGSVGGLLVLLLGLACVPTAAIWSAGFATGPGFAVGVGTAVSPAGVSLGSVPAFPFLGALPSTGPAPAVSLIAVAVPLVAGIVVGWFAAHRPAPTDGRTVAEACVAGVASGIGLGVLAWLSSGSLGAGHLAQLGPDAWKVGGVAALEIGAVAAAVAWEVSRHGTVIERSLSWTRRLPATIRASVARRGRSSGSR